MSRRRLPSVAAALAFAACAVVGCGSTVPTATASPSSRIAPSPSSSPTALSALRGLVATFLRTPDFSVGAATSACGQPDKASCMAYELRGDGHITAFDAGDRELPQSSAIVTVDANLHRDLVQWTQLADSLLADFANGAQRRAMAYTLDTANAQILSALNDIAQ